MMWTSGPSGLGNHGQAMESQGRGVKDDSRALRPREWQDRGSGDRHGSVRRSDVWGKEGDSLCLNISSTQSLETGNVSWSDVGIWPLVTLLSCVR